MKTARYGQAKVVLPDLDDELPTVEDLGLDGELAEFVYSDHSLRQLDLAGRRLARGRVRGVEVEQADFTGTALDSISFERCALLSSQWHGCSLSRVEFRDCKVIGAAVVEQKWANVVFRDCVLEYVTLDAVRAAGPVVFVDCRFREVTFTGCRLPGGHISGSQLHAVTFIGGDYRNFDLRGNDLSTVRGAANLSGAIVTQEQRQQLAEALVAEVDLNYIEDGQ